MTKFIERNVLLLNTNYDVIDIISWQRAITLIFKQRVNVIEEFEDSVISSATSSMKMPSIIVCHDYIGILNNVKKIVNLNRRNVLIRDNYTCLYCGKALTDSTGTIDHIQPVSRKGKNSWDNVVAACIKCNRKKNDKTPEESGMKLLRKPFTPSRNIFLKKYLKREEYASWRSYISGKDVVFSNVVS